MKKIFQTLAFSALCIGMMSSTVTTTATAVPATETPAPATIGETIKSATASFKNLSKSERNERLKQVKKEIKNYKKQEKQGAAAPSTNTLLLVILAILLPPLAVYLHQGEINNKFWIALVLTLLFFVPGVIYALIVVLGDK